MEIKNVAVLGAGIMGSGIAQLAAQAGYQVFLRDIGEKLLSKGMATIKESLGRFVKSGKIPAEKVEEVLARIKVFTELEPAVKEADIVVEAIPEILDLKIQTFAELDKLCPPHTIFASNTSQFSITLIGSQTERRDKVVGTHFFNPAVVMKLVEIIRAMETSDETLEATVSFCHSLGKETVVCKKDTQGFITSRLLLAQRVEAYRLLEEGIATVEDIDKAMRLAFNHPMGPFQLADFAGLDTGLRALEGLYSIYGDRYRPPQFLRQMVACGYLGRKTGRGFYEYDK